MSYRDTLNSAVAAFRYPRAPVSDSRVLRPNPHPDVGSGPEWGGIYYTEYTFKPITIHWYTLTRIDDFRHCWVNEQIGRRL